MNHSLCSGSWLGDREVEPRFSGPEPDVLPLACPPCLPAGRYSPEKKDYYSGDLSLRLR